jgi:hypothetical protein
MADLKTPVKKNCMRCREPFLAKRNSSWNCEACIKLIKEERVSEMNRARGVVTKIIKEV